MFKVSYGSTVFQDNLYFKDGQLYAPPIRRRFAELLKEMTPVWEKYDREVHTHG